MKNETEVLLRELAEKLGTTVEHLYGVLTKEAEVNIKKAFLRIGINALLLIAGITVLNLTTWVPPTKTVDKYGLQDYYFSSSAILYIIAWVLNAIYWLISVYNTQQNIELIIESKINPEYRAVQEVINAVSARD